MPSFLIAAALLACTDGPSVRKPPGSTDASEESEVPVTEATELTDATEAPTEPPPCPEDMVLVEDLFCMDRYEAPNVAGELPLVMYTLVESEDWCEAHGKRLCFDSEWQKACEGPDQKVYPYGDTHQPGKCNDDKLWKVYTQSLLNQWPSDASEPDVESLDQLFANAGSAADHVEDLYQGEGGGENPDCGGHYGVYDLVGNVEEWTRRADGGTPDFHGTLKGRYWAESRTCQNGVKTHGDLFRFYEIGFRCCTEVGGF